MSSPEAGASARGSVVTIYEGFLRVLRSPLATIAAVNGPAVGAGMNLALACDIRVVGASGRFDARFLQIGLHPGGGHTWMLDRLVGPQTAAAIVLFGERVDGPRAVEVGLAWSCHPDTELLEAARALGARAAKVPRPLVARAKETLRAVPREPFDTALAREIENQTWSFTQGWFHRPT
jgi:enoyl-CoA hydratase